MNKLRKILLFALIASLTIVSCKKDEDDDERMEENIDTSGAVVNPEDYPELLAGIESRSWTSNSFTLMGTSQDCRLDDTFTFNADNTYTYDGGDQLCGDEDNVTTKNGTWVIDENSEHIIFDQGTDYEYSAVIASAKEFEITLTGTYMLMPISGSYTF